MAASGSILSAQRQQGLGPCASAMLDIARIALRCVAAGFVHGGAVGVAASLPFVALLALVMVFWILTLNPLSALAFVVIALLVLLYGGLVGAAIGTLVGIYSGLAVAPTLTLRQLRTGGSSPAAGRMRTGLVLIVATLVALPTAWQALHDVTGRTFAYPASPSPAAFAAIVMLTLAAAHVAWRAVPWILTLSGGRLLDLLVPEKGAS